MKLAPLGDDAVIATLGEKLDVETASAACALSRALLAKPLPGVGECVPANASVTVFYDPGRVPKKKDATPYDRVCQWVASRAAAAKAPELASARRLVVPVCYGGEFGADLDAVASAHGLEPAQVVALHSGADYFVSAVGFAPGFAYLVGMPEELHTPRRKTPRTRVPAGSVAIGGAQTGIYPFETPGGWNLIGATPWRLFHPYAEVPTRLQTGDCVRFKPVTPEEFATLRNSP